MAGKCRQRGKNILGWKKISLDCRLTDLKNRTSRLRRELRIGLTLRHDHGSQFIAEDFQQEIAFLGIKDSASYAREPQGNGIAERFVPILKENLLWVRSFRTVEELRLALLAFKESYNRQWRIGRHGYSIQVAGSGQGKSEGDGR